MIHDGRLSSAWLNRYAIKDIQRDVYATGTRVDKKEAEKKSNQNSGTGWFHREINEDTDGKPCVV